MEFQDAVDKKKNLGEAYRGLGLCYWEQKKYEKAEKALEKALKNGTEETATLYNILGICDLELDKPEITAEVEEQDDTLLVRRTARLKKANVKTLPYPGFPTDMQPQMTTVLTLAQGTSLVTEGVWSSRYRYVDELKRMGASIQVDDKTAVVEGVDHLTGAPIQACDLRAGAAMVIAGLAAQGTTEIGCIHHIERGYEDIVRKLSGVGADIRVVVTPDEEKQSQVG